MRFTEEAVKLVAARPKMRAAYPIPPLPDLVALVIYLIASLKEICAPTPTEGLAFLAWRPFKVFDWGGHRLGMHRATVEVQIAMRWKGSQKEFRAFADSVWDAIDDGKLTPELMSGMYSEARR